MTTRIELAKSGIVTDEARQVARAEGVSPEKVSGDIAKGLTVIARNKNHDTVPLGIGSGLRTKINANIGTSRDRDSLDDEKAKLDVLLKYGCDAIMDLSTGGKIRELRSLILGNYPFCFGTVPIYEAAVESVEKYGRIAKMTADDLFAVIRRHGEEGVDFITAHAGITLKAIERLKQEGRVLDVVSRGGSFLFEWMIYNGRENPLYEQYDRLLGIAREFDMTLSLGDAMRPGCIEDATDRAQIEELLVLGELRDRALDAGVQVIIEGPGHVPLPQVELNIRMQKEICKGAPFYVLGPLVTDIGVGYDHIVGAIGGAIAGAAGADFLCYLTPSEHIRLPNVEDVKEGLVASKIAAHAADLAKGIAPALEKDRKMARMRKALDWEGMISMSLDPDKVRAYRQAIPPSEKEVCSMCGEFCAIRTVERALKGGK
ncbi:MAG: phosphomethylpyrimidine synthase ThiC [Nitrospiraceae bacterium]|nr:phosphomethylpyrimidine synthase ThiC [Nitrospiraceae bacterium]